jgi:pimeloyl-ACP methyl ester carboxylesterase
MSLDQMSQMLGVIINNKDFAGQFLRTLSKTYYKCADIGECFSTIGRIGDRGFDIWYDEWGRTAERVRQLAEDSLKGGHRVSAREGFLRACEYYRQSYWFLREHLDDPRILSATDNLRDCFGKAISLLDTPVHTVEIPYGNTTLPGYFYLADDSGKPKPTVVMPGGYDGIVEEMYAAGAGGTILRGYNCLTFDGPGQGHALIRRRLYMRHDFESVLSPVLDWLLEKPEVAKDKVILIGRSFGGYLAPRGACGEKRLRALVCDPGQMDIAGELPRKLPPEVLKMWKDGDANGVNGFFEELFEKNPPMRFFFLSRMPVHGISSVYDFLNEISRYSFKDKVSTITCPTLVCDNPTDTVASRGNTLYDALTCKKDLISFQDSDGAGAHCEAGATGLFEQQVFDWIGKTL